MSPSTMPRSGGAKVRAVPAVEVTGFLCPGPESRGEARAFGHLGCLKLGPPRAVTLPQHSSRATLWKRKREKKKKKGNHQQAETLSNS